MKLVAQLRSTEAARTAWFMIHDGESAWSVLVAKIWYPLVMTNGLLLKMAIEIVDLP